jgi:hypothetical protein
VDAATLTGGPFTQYSLKAHFKRTVFYVSISSNHILAATTHAVHVPLSHVVSLTRSAPVALMIATIVATVEPCPFAVRDEFTGLLVGLIQQSPVQLLKGSDFSFKMS